MCTRSSRDNWERLVAAVIKKEQIWQLCHQDSITTVDSDFSERDLSLRSGPSSPSHQLLTRNSVIDEVRKDGSGSTKRFSALFWRKKPKEYGMAGFISVADSDTFSAESSTTLSTKNSPVLLYDGTLLEMGTYLSTPKTKKLSEDGENNRLRYGLSSMQGWRATMEDAHAAITDLDASTSFFGVYDGHGGKVVAKFCAKYLHQQVLKQEAYTSDDIGTSVQKSFFRMDEMMRGQRGWRELAVLGDKINKFTGMIEGLIWSPRSGDKSDRVDDWAFEEGPHSDFSGPTSGCTACVAIIRENQLVVANAGDSRCVISRNGQAYNLSRDHKPDLEVERDRILKAGGFIHAGRVNGSLNLARAIGDMEFKQNKFLPPEKQIVTASPDINIVELCDDDEFIVLACDGIWDCMSSQQLVDFIREQLKSETKLSAVCEKVLDRCLAPSTAGGEGCDNMTMILVQFMKPTHSAASSDNKSSASEEEPAEPNNAAESE